MEQASLAEKNLQFPFEEKNFLGNRLRELRLTFGFKQSDVAKALNVSRSTYSYYETGTTRPDPAVLGKLSRYYNISVETFYEEAPLVEVDLRDSAGHRHRTSRSAAADPQKVGELLPAERSLILFLRSNNVAAKNVLEDLEKAAARKKQEWKRASREAKD